MKHIVITGSTRGIGYGLAEAFLDLNCSVTVSGRGQVDVDQTILKLSERHPSEHLFGLASDVRDPKQIQSLWDRTQDRFQKVDIWVNNAGFSGIQVDAWKIAPEIAKEIIETNILGTMYGSMIAIQGMLSQGFGALYNMEGMGSDGRMVQGLTYYGTSKYALRYYTKSLREETKNSPIIIGSLRPGMVATEMITKPYEDRPEDWERDKRMFNILSDRVETVTPWLARKMLENTNSGEIISWSSPWKIMGRFLASPFHKRNIFD